MVAWLFQQKYVAPASVLWCIIVSMLSVLKTVLLNESLELAGTCITSRKMNVALKPKDSAFNFWLKAHSLWTRKNAIHERQNNHREEFFFALRPSRRTVCPDRSFHHYWFRLDSGFVRLSLFQPQECFLWSRSRMEQPKLYSTTFLNFLLAQSYDDFYYLITLCRGAHLHRPFTYHWEEQKQKLCSVCRC